MRRAGQCSRTDKRRIHRILQSGVVPAQREATRYGLGRYGTWRSLVSALDWGSRGREFKSPRPDEAPRNLTISRPRRGGRAKGIAPGGRIPQCEAHRPLGRGFGCDRRHGRAGGLRQRKRQPSLERQPSECRGQADRDQRRYDYRPDLEPGLAAPAHPGLHQRGAELRDVAGCRRSETEAREHGGSARDFLRQLRSKSQQRSHPDRSVGSRERAR